MNLEAIIVSEMRQRQIPFYLTYMQNLLKKKWNSWKQIAEWWLPGTEESGRWEDREMLVVSCYNE